MVVAPVPAEERILDFHTRVGADGTMAITETIKVVAERNRIERGIYRNISLHYRGASLFAAKVYIQF